MRTHVSFETEPSGAMVDMAAAAILAKRLTAGLQRRGLKTTPVTALPYAQAFEVRHGGRVFYSMLGPANDGVRQWLWFADSTLGRIRHVLGARDEVEHRAVLAAMHHAVAEIDAWSIRWYEPGDWNEAPDDRWYPDPVA